MSNSPHEAGDRTKEDPRAKVTDIVDQVIEIVCILGITQEAEHAKAGVRSQVRTYLLRLDSADSSIKYKPFHWTPLKFPKETDGSDVHISIEAKNKGSAGLNYTLSHSTGDNEQKVVSHTEVWVDPNGTAIELKCRVLDRGDIKRLFVNLVGMNETHPLTRTIVDTDPDINIIGMGDYNQWQEALAFLRSYVSPLIPELTKALEKGTIQGGLS